METPVLPLLDEFSGHWTDNVVAGMSGCRCCHCSICSRRAQATVQDGRRLLGCAAAARGRLREATRGAEGGPPGGVQPSGRRDVEGGGVQPPLLDGAVLGRAQRVRMDGPVHVRERHQLYKRHQPHKVRYSAVVFLKRMY
ncbi:hypothetical protein ON010_g746 [Phytophthora cinnamomi]|nr:hypothetical protein ON010_g746 [Phytophthora cinnamomi]